jgi:hypothetical protein
MGFEIAGSIIIYRTTREAFMPTKKRRTKKKVSVTVIGAIIAAIAAIIAAIIGIYPNLRDTDANTRITVTVTPETLIEYEDPLGIFTIEYPSSFFLDDRGGVEGSIALLFNNKNKTASDNYIDTIAIWFERLDDPNSDVESLMHKRIVDVLEKKFEGVLEWTLISNERTSKGYFTHYLQECPPCEIKKSHSFELFEIENGISVIVGISVPGDEITPETINMVDRISKSFQWSSVKVDKSIR